jgi:hypothetical protein
VTTTTTTPRYLVGYARCGCAVFAALTDPAHGHTIAAEVERARRSGLDLTLTDELPARGYLAPGCERCRVNGEQR